MKKSYLFAVAFAGMGLLISAGACSSKSDKTISEDSAEQIVEDSMMAPATESMVSDYAKLFSDPAKKSDVPTDSTYAETKTGLKYIVLKEGSGKAPKATDVVTVNYEGQLLDGTVFDSSYSRGVPAEFPLNAVIRGWTEGLQLMKEGGKAVFYLPSDIAYGEMGTPRGPIGPNADLIFTVELIKVN